MDEDFSLDEFEQQQLERERRRIILDQAVRRKTIDSWVSSRLSLFPRPLDEDVAYDDTEVPALAPPLPPRNPGCQRISWPLGRHSCYDSPPSSPAPPLPTSALPTDSGPSAARLDLRQKRGANMADQDDQQLIGFDDSPVVLPTEPKKGASPSEAERILNSLNAEKSQLAAATNGHTDEAATTNGHHQDAPEKAVNGLVPKAEHNEAGEPVYTEVPEDNIYEEVIPVQENKAEVALSPTVQTTTTENGVTGVLYDDSSLSSEVSAELSLPPSNVGDCASNGTALSDPECDAAMAEASAPESHADIPFVVVQESTPVDSEQSNDEHAEDSASEQAAEEGCKAEAAVEAAIEASADTMVVVEPLVKPVVLPVEKDTAPPSEEQTSGEHRCTAQPPVLAASAESCTRLDHIESEFTRVDNVQFVEPEDMGRCSVVSVTETAPERETAVEERRGHVEVVVHTEDIVSSIEEITPSTQASLAEHGLQHETEEPLQCQDFPHEAVLAGCEPAQGAEPPAVRHESRHLKPSAADSIVAREIRAQKEREEMIARERKLAQEAARLSSTALEKTLCDRTVTPETLKPARLTVSQLPTASPTSPPSMVSSPAPFPAPIEKRFTCPSDSKIADEIRELQEREEELRELRERLHIQSNDHRCSAGGLINNDDAVVAANGMTSPLASLTSSSGLSRTVSVESLPPNGSIHTPFGPRRKDKITVRPLSDGTEDSVPSSTFVSHGGESPIEREIRLARDREEALRKEKGLLGQLQAEGFVKKGEVASSASVKGAKATVVLRGSTQKILATSRIQQEIEEQTQREMALRESGHIQTISQERTDSKVTRIGNEASTAASPSPSLASTTRRVPPFESSLPNIEIFEKTPAIVIPTRVCSPTAAPCGVASAVAKATNGHMHANGHAAGAKVSPVANVRGVSMQKFLASRGKELAFTSSPPPQNGDKLEYRELKPPQLQKGAIDAVRKGLVTAETKIQEEMRAMKEREEELRRQRLRLLGQSQPNLSLFEGSTVADADHATDATDGPALQHAGSDANLLEQTTVTDSSEAANVSNTSSVPRRRSALIAQWEQRIQSTNVAKS
ncbi:uncharacterized protein LOC142559769 isoform X2 [Dermacentor variabilis]|uniref:uncharacterized protein LOC142559769 isoform X2 n=1 Tax=Dermacentor variabilis TaxID=34621 RepID=UPI003F5C11E2